MKIGVVGLGLIGGSIYKKLTELKYDVVGISESQNGKESNITNDLNALKDCKLIFVATPMHSTIAKLKEIEKIANKNTIVTDCCSLKEFLTNKSFDFTFIPSHPMAGTEFSGYENSYSELFQDAKWVITPINNENTKILEEVIKEIGAKPIITTPKKHDEAVAIISHMPMIIAQGLMKTLKDNELAKKLASSGFRDMTRLAMSNTEMANDMINYNHKNIEQSLLNLYKDIGELIKNYPNEIKKLKINREKMYTNGKNNL